MITMSTLSGRQTCENWPLMPCLVPGRQRTGRKVAPPLATWRGSDLLLRVRREHVGDAERQPARRRDVKELVRAVRVRAGAEHAGDAELRLGELLTEHVHERDRAAFAHVHRRL